MALSSSIYKVDISLSNLDTHYYQDLNLTIAKHPSETESRMIYRLLAFLYCAHEDLVFTKGLGDIDEPTIWRKNDIGEIIQWIDMGLPDLKRIRQSLGKSHFVKVFTYQEEKALDWFNKIKGNFLKNNKLEIFHFKINNNGPIDKFVERTMKLSCIIEDGTMQFSNDEQIITVSILKAL